MDLGVSKVESTCISAVEMLSGEYLYAIVS